ncbi:MAG: tRNA pseudouridine(55) synthase TruB [Marinilabiliaceae bacterium]|nr:tRNA pseudouridine(55) synthase TruB [Marinilabiliaceae bacterium]
MELELEALAEKYKAGQVLLINKPLTWTSFDVVNKIRYSLKKYLGIKKIKVGHAGTLDPLATGLMIVCTGKATKEIDQYLGQKKRYVASVRLGATTPTLDMETEPDQEFPWKHITKQWLEEVVQSFQGEIEQVPPVFSALKVNGRKAYEMARKGQEVKMQPRQVTIHDMQVLESNLPDFKVDVTCSKGTYIRSLARDLGTALESGAFLTGLVRTEIGDFNLDMAQSIEAFEKKLKEIVTNE